VLGCRQGSLALAGKITVLVHEGDPHVKEIGVKGQGELSTHGVAAAIANAVHHATGVRIRDLPITPDKLIQG
jgi:xanthine dehydrogenase YagR molybdenum-binding subunit